MQVRELTIKHMDEAVAEVERLKEGYHKCAEWSLEENLDHLNKTMTMSLEGADWGLPKLIRPILRWMFLEKIRTGVSSALKLRAKAPPSLRPGTDLALDEKCAEFMRLSQRVESPDAQFIDSHPVFGRISREDWRAMLRWHTAHHLSYLIPNSANSG